MQLVARRMIRQKRGCIINLCSVGGIEAQPGYLAYGSSKAAMIWETRCASRELGAYTIRVNGIAPMQNLSIQHRQNLYTGQAPTHMRASALRRQSHVQRIQPELRGRLKLERLRISLEK